MRLNGWWRIAVVIMALIMGLTLLNALSGTSQVALASIPYDPPYPANATNPFEAALSCGQACDRYDKVHKADVQRLAARLSQQNGCISGTTRYEDQDNSIAVLCRTSGEMTGMIEVALIACGVLVLIGLTIGWVAGGFRSARRPTAQ